MFIVQYEYTSAAHTPHSTLATFSKSYRSLLLSLAFVPMPLVRISHAIGYSNLYALLSEPISSFSSGS